MKRYLNILSMVVLTVTVGFSSASCSSEEDNEDNAMYGKTPLKINVTGVNTTKAFFEGTMLPDECKYYISLFNNNSSIAHDVCYLPVNYTKGESTLTEPIYITDNGKITAVYCDSEINRNNNTSFPINTDAQQDILVAHSRVTPEYPEVSLTFKHIMARVVLRITKSAENNRTYEFGNAEVGGLYSGYYLLYDDKVINERTTSLKVSTKGNKVLSKENDVIEYEFLTTPQSSYDIIITVSGTLYVSLRLPKNTLYGGNRYVFNAVIKGSNLEIQSVSVEPWSQETHDMEIDLNK